jgi:hypothetical protein
MVKRRGTTLFLFVLGAAAAALLITVGAGPRAFTRAQRGPGRALGDADLLSIYTAWMASPYEHMFEGAGQPAGNLPYGTFMGGIGGIMRYGGMAEAAAKHLKIRQRGFYDLTPVEKLSKLTIYKRRSTSLKDFSRYNPTLIRWGHQNLIPAPGLKVGGHSCQQLYDGIFARFFRLMTESYVLLRGSRDLRKERRAYLRAMKRRGFDGINYLQRRFAGDLRTYSTSQNGTNFTPPMAVGFWIRRSVDKTDTELWTGLQKLMRQYDLKWWSALQQRLKSKAGAKRPKVKRPKAKPRLRRPKHRD